MSKTVLVTGASGFVAKHCIRALVAAGYAVRGTVRDPRRASEIARACGLGAGGPSLALAAADLTSDVGWDAAVAGCDAVLHVASPFPMSAPRHRDEVIAPARAGTLRVLKAAAKAGVARVVLTSSIVAVVYPQAARRSGPYTEADWTDPEQRDLSAYVASKTLAERDAWAFVKNEAPSLELVTINPGFVAGPALDPDLPTSLAVLRMMAQGKYPAAPRAGYAIADARDVAAAHVRALERPEARGERFLIANGFLTLKEMGDIIARALPDVAGRVPRLEVPDALVRGMALFDRSLLAVLPDLSQRRECSNAKARERLGLTFHSPEDAISAAAHSLRALRLV